MVPEENVAVATPGRHREPKLDPDTSRRHPHGTVFTRRWVVDLVLDLARYSPEQSLADLQLLEPSCGDGAFLEAVAERAIASCLAEGRDLSDLRGAVTAYDLQAENVKKARARVAQAFVAANMSPRDAAELARGWVTQGDFLLAEHDEQSFDFVVGNPPYIRMENVQVARMDTYRLLFPTMRGRADIYIGFYEQGLRLLTKGGRLSFICADRWMRNSYGSHLRAMVSDEFAVEATVEMHQTEAFDANVSAYPSVTVIRRGDQVAATVATATADFSPASAVQLARWHNRSPKPGTEKQFQGGLTASRLGSWFAGSHSWPSGSARRLALLADLEKRFDPLQIGTTKVGIGVATGADEAFIVQGAGNIEPDRLVPLLRTGDIASGKAFWSESYLVNPWQGPNQLISLDEFPGTEAHFRAHERLLRGRHVAARSKQSNWYRTIDPVHTALVPLPKLLFADMKLRSAPVLDPGGHYPHHNLYYVISQDWDLEVLGGLLMSDVAQFFMESYAVRMRGGTLRFQAQYLRRIRVPQASSLDAKQRASLRHAFRTRDQARATALAFALYGIDELPA